MAPHCETASDRWLFAAVVMAGVALHAWLAASLPLSGDEAYYWDCARHLDWSYFDQPGLVIWPIRLATAVLGDTALAVRFPAMLASLLSAFFLLPLVRRLGGGARQAAVAVVLWHAMPVYFFGAFYESTDAGMMAAWIGATWAAVALAQGERRAWWGFGLALGLGFLAKFPIVLALPALVPALRVPAVRRHLATPVPWLAAAMSCVLTAPVWIWAARHHWDNIRFQLSGRHETHHLTLRYLGEFVGANLLLATPFLAAALAVAWWRGWRRRDPAWRVLLVAAASPLVVFGLVSLRERVGGHWGVPGLVVAMAALVLIEFRGRRTLIALGAVFGFVLSLALVTAVLHPEQLLGRRWHLAGRTFEVPERPVAMAFGYREVAADLQSRLAPGEWAACESYTTVHLLAFYSGGRLPVLLARLTGGRHGLAGLYWHRPETLQGRDVLFVTEREGVEDRLAGLFLSVEEEAPIEVRVAGRVIRTFRVLRCQDLLHPEGAFTLLPRSPSGAMDG
jgi:4-amino-4-deoxy-L-arabinose transferase-like glycosyltransferase